MTKIERLILSNQYRLLQKLDKENQKHYEELIEILENGYECQYTELTQWFRDEVPSEVCYDVSRVLEMHSLLLDSYRQLADKSGIEVSKVKFAGFSAKDESDYYHYTKFRLKYDESPNFPVGMHTQIDSYTAMMPRYRSMLRRLDASPRDDSRFLAKEQIIKITE